MDVCALSRMHALTQCCALLGQKCHRYVVSVGSIVKWSVFVLVLHRNKRIRSKEELADFKVACRVFGFKRGMHECQIRVGSRCLDYRALYLQPLQVPLKKLWIRIFSRTVSRVRIQWVTILQGTYLQLPHRAAEWIHSRLWLSHLHPDAK